MDENHTNDDGRMFCLSEDNWPIWKDKMEDILYCKDLYLPLEGDEKKPEKMSDEEWRVLNRKTIGTIRKWLDMSCCHQIAGEKSASVVWGKLQERYERKTVGNKTLLIRKLVNLKYKDGASVSEHLNQVQSIVNQLLAMEVVLDEEMQAMLLLSSLPDSWETLVISVSNSTPDGKLTMTQVTGSLLNEETRRKASGVDQPQALVHETRGRSKSRKPNDQGKSSARSKSRGHSKGSFECYYCGKKGHMKRNCRSYISDKKEGKIKETHHKEETTATITSTDEVVILCDGDQCLHVDDNEIEWVIDTGASYHATPRRDLFATYKAGDFGNVKMGNDSFSKICGVGDICITTNVGCTLVLKDVRHVPDLRLNLMSGLALDRQGYVSQFGENAWKLTRGSLVVAKGKVCCTLYKTASQVCRDGLHISEHGVSPNLWHRRLAHMSEKGLEILAKKKKVTFLDSESAAINPCDDCLVGKHHRSTFHKRAGRQSELLELVHTDVCGPLEVETHGGNRYFLTFIDDSSRKVWIYFLRSKDLVFEHFKLFHALVERETGKKLKCLRSDNGGEYTSRLFRGYCTEHGIRHERTIPRTPEQNGLAERMNRTIMEKVRSMLATAKLPKSFWGEAANTACYLINRSPSAPLEGEVPEKVWTKKEVSYTHLRVFGCKALIHVPKEQRMKLDDRATPCIFTGYGDEEFGYRLFDPKQRRFVRSRDVVFYEDQTIEDLNKAEAPRKEKNRFDDEEDTSPVSSSNPQAENGGATEVEEPVEVVPTGDVVAEPTEEPLVQIPAEIPEPHTRRSDRVKRPSTRYPNDEYQLLVNEGEPEGLQEALTHEDKAYWRRAMQEEMDSLHKNDTYELVEMPQGGKILRNKWVYKLKTDGTGQIVKYKARLVVKGFQQREGIDFTEIFSPVVKMTSIRLMMGLAACLDLEIEQLDVKTAFLHGNLNEEIYMAQPEGFEVKGKEQLVCRLKKSLYGLKQAPRQWYLKFDSFMLSHEYKRAAADHCVYIRYFSESSFIVLLLYVDDMLIVGKDVSLINKLKSDLFKSFDMKDLGPTKQMLGMKIERDRKARRLWLSQEAYVEKVLERFGMKNAKPASTPLVSLHRLSKEMSPTTDEGKREMLKIPYASAVGSLMYAMVCTRPDIAHAVGVVSKYLSNPGKEHWAAIKWVLRYLRGTSKLRLCFGGGEPVLDGYTDSDMAGDFDNKRSTSGYVFTFAGGAVSWKSQLQKCVALSTTEAEFIALSEAGKELKWLKCLFQGLGLKQKQFVIFCDNQSAIDLSKNSTHHGRTKHIDVRYRWIQEANERGELEVEKIHTSKNPSDMLTKVVTKDKHELCRKLVGML